VREIHRRIVLSTIAILLFVAAPSLCFAMMPIEVVSQKRAKELGMEIRSNVAGPDAVRVELEFKPEGELKSYSRVDLEMRQGSKLLMTSILREERSKPRRVVVGFAADRGNLDKTTLRVVTQSAPRDMTGYELRVKDFVDLEKVR
jgi:hypothetical protein